jgi:sugar lactone lactonase YvrE
VPFSSRVRFAVLLLIVAGVSVSNWESLAQNRSEADKALPNPYRTIENYFKMPAGRTWGGSSAIDIDPDGTSIWVAERCAANSCLNSNLQSVFEFDTSGTMIRSFGAGLIGYPHGIHVDRQGNVWVVDGQSNLNAGRGRGRGARGDAPGAPAIAPAPPAAPPSTPRGMQVIKFSPEGKVLMTLGAAGVPGTDESHFNQPSDVVTAPNGDIFVADGHGGDSNARIVKFSRDGKFIKAWGHKGAGPGELNTPHSITIDSRGRLFVADRENSRIQIFDQDGKYLDQWKQFGRPSGVYIDKNDMLYAADSESNTARNHNEFLRGIHVGSARTGVVTAFLPDPLGNQDEGPLVTTSAAEGLAADAQGNVYGIQVRPFGLFKYVKK